MKNSRTKEQLAIREALELMSPVVPSCSGCDYEWREAMSILKNALSKKKPKRVRGLALSQYDETISSMKKKERKKMTAFEKLELFCSFAMDGQDWLDSGEFFINVEDIISYPDAPMVCAESYQVIGLLADSLGQFDHPQVTKALDNAADHTLIHKDVLPFPILKYKKQKN
jgi:hypothetical protein